MNIINRGLLLLLAITLVSCGGGSGGGSTGNATDTEAPIFNGFALVVSGDTDLVSTAWFPATDNSTPENDLTYELHIGTQANFLPSTSSLYQTYIGESSAKVTGLNPATEYFFKIIAIDLAGNQFEADDYATATTATEPVVRTYVETAEAESLGLGLATIDNTDNSVFTFTPPANSTNPVEGSVLIGEDSNGEGYLRMIDTVTQNGNSLELQTSSASLTDIFETASISSEVVLRATDQAVSARSSSLPRSTSRSRSGDLSHKLEWKDKILTITETGQSGSAPTVRSRSARALDTSNTDIEVSASNALTLTGTIDFEPSVKTNVKLSAFRVASAKTQLSGTLSAKVKLAYDYKGKVSISESQEVFNRTFVSKYLVGQVPVYQETTLKLTAKFTGSAETTLNAATEATLSTNVTIDVVYDGNDWVATTSNSFDKDLTISASAHGTATAEVRLIPEVKVRFYKAVSTTISVEPYTRAIVTAEAVTATSLIENDFMQEYGFTKFDAFIGADVYVAADMRIFSATLARYPETGREKLYNFEEQLFGLPKLEGTADVTGDSEYSFSATTTPFTSATGIINEFDTASANWLVFPENKSISGKSVKYTGDPENVYFIGNSKMLGEIGRQYIEVEIKIGIDGTWLVDCSADEFIVNSNGNVDDTEYYYIGYRPVYIFDYPNFSFAINTYEDDEHCEGDPHHQESMISGTYAYSSSVNEYGDIELIIDFSTSTPGVPLKYDLRGVIDGYLIMYGNTAEWLWGDGYGDGLGETMKKQQ